MTTEMRLPKAWGLSLCERVKAERGKRGLSLIGTFQVLRFSKFPTAKQKFAAFAELYDGAGEGTIQLRCMRLENEQDIYRFRRWITLPGPQLWANMEVKITKCIFPAPGRYEFFLEFDNHEITSHVIDVYME